MDHTAAGGIELGVLGPLAVRSADGPVVITREAQRRLLALLATDGSGRISTERLIDRFWDGAPPSSAKTAIQTHVSAVRRLLPDGAIVTVGRGYALDRAVVGVDAERFEHLARRAREAGDAHRWRDALADADAALALWRGDPFEELPDDEPAIAARARLGVTRLSLLVLRAEALVALGRHDDAAPGLEALLLEHPTHERGWELLATALARAGRTADALRALHDARQRLADVGLVPAAELVRLERDLLDVEPTASKTTVSKLPNPITSFVGRHVERAEVAERLARHRLVTVTGVGGAGKSRLAIEVARAWLDAAGPSTPCWFVELASITRPDEVDATVAAAIGVVDDGASTVDGIARTLADRGALLVLDNCEHLAGAVAALVRSVLTAADDTRVLATSRVTLGLLGESVYELPPLAVGPDDGSDAADGRDADGGAASDAVTLFVERAALERTGGANTVDRGTIAELCRALDGLPLAIELAAARTRTMSVATILERATDRLGLLRMGDPTLPERQRTIEAAIAWSYDLLDAEAQRLLARMSVFRSPVDLAMVVAVCGADDDLDDDLDVDAALDRLVAQSLVTVRRGDDVHRYELLWTIRDYASERCREFGDVDAVLAAHLAHCVEIADSRSIVARGGLVRLDLADGVPVEEVRRALELARERHDPRATMLLAGLLGAILDLRNRSADAEELYEIALTGDAGRDETIGIRMLRAIAVYQRDELQAVDELAELAGEVADDPPSSLTAAVHLHAGLVHQMCVRYPTEVALPYYRRAVELADALADPYLQLRARSVMATALAWCGHDAEALAQADASVATARAGGGRLDLLRALDFAIGVVFLTGERRRAGSPEWCAEALALAEQLAAPHPLPIDWLPYGLMQVGDLDGAARSIELQLGSATLDGLESGLEFLAWHTVNAYVAWFRGDLDTAEEHLVHIRPDVHPRWAHDVYPMAAHVALLRGEHDRVDALVDEYLALEVDATEEVHKAGVLQVQAQLHVDRALAADTVDERAHWAERAADVVDHVRRLVRESPLTRTGSLQVERPTTWLAIAEAELTRLDADGSGDGSGPRAWQHVVDVADYPWFREYAARRRREAVDADGAT